MRGSEDLDLLLSASNTLLHRVHIACGGFPKESKCRMFVDTYHEVSISINEQALPICRHKTRPSTALLKKALSKLALVMMR
jgi:hypothetical protein